MGLEVARDDAAGYAFVRQADETEEDQEEWEDSNEAPLPRVLRRTRLSYHQTIFMVLLREELMRFEQEQEEGDHLYRSSPDLREIMLPYYLEMHDEKKIHRQISSMITKFEEWGILKKVHEKEDGLYRVERIIKAKLPPDKLAEVRDQIRRRSPDLEEERKKMIFDSQLELEFAPDKSTAGYRLHELSVLNWGTFHNQVYSMRPDGRTV